MAKAAADIVIMDDNFSSIVKSVLWGRSVFSNIRRFLQFQLTISFAALVCPTVLAICCPALHWHAGMLKTKPGAFVRREAFSC